MGGHHLILGEARDYLTGTTLVDTHDERYRQMIARFLVEEKGYRRHEVTPRVALDVRVDGRRAKVRLDFIICLDERIALLLKYAPGSLTTRHQVALAASRLLAPYQVPFSVVTNGEDADVLSNYTGDIVASGLDGIFAREDLKTRLQACERVPVSGYHREMAARIMYAYEVDGRCPCDDTVCEEENH